MDRIQKRFDELDEVSQGIVRQMEARTTSDGTSLSETVVQWETSVHSLVTSVFGSDSPTCSDFRDSRESEVHRLLTNERILGLDLLRGRKVSETEEDHSSSEAVTLPASVAALPHPADVDTVGEDADAIEADTEGLPLFGDPTSSPGLRD